jgi:5'(3')-deoxyribonucleotidase
VTQSPRRLRIAVDMDEVIADALAEHLHRYNAAFGAALRLEDLRGGHLEDLVPPAHRAAALAMVDASFFEDLAVMPGAREVLLDLSSRHDVFIVSAAMDVPCSFDAKYRWLQKHFAFIPPSQIVFCGDKGIVDADYLIDDRARHFAYFRGQGLLFSAPHNAEETRYARVGSWADVRVFFARLAARVARASRAATPRRIFHSCAPGLPAPRRSRRLSSSSPALAAPGRPARTGPPPPRRRPRP